MRGTMVPVLAVVAIVVIALVAFLLVRAPGTQPVSPPTAAAPKPAPTSGSPVAAGKPSGQVPTSPHPTPQEEAFKGCPGEGDGTDPELNRLKNRVDEAAWQPVAVEALLGLKWPADIGRKHLAQWTQADHAQIDPFNGVPVQAEGYLLQVRQEGPESPNCHSAEDLDFHIWLAAQPDDDRATRSVVIEFTPRVRARHPTWALEALQGLARQKTRVRISGWTMLDPEHPDEVGKSRGTIWEIHPVMRVETQQGSGWKEL